MRLFRTALALLLVLSFTLFAAVPVGAASENLAFATDQILVKFKAGTDQATQGAIHRKYGGAVVTEIKQLGVKVIKVPASSVLDKVKAYQSEKTVAFAEPDFIAEAIEVPNDPYFSNQWGLSKVQAPDAWNITTGSTGIKIAILDTGVDQNHEDLAKIVANKNFTNSSTVDDLYGHGTHVAGIAAATTNNGIGVAGLGYDSVIMNVKVLDDRGSGQYSWIANGITWAADNGAKVINMSLGGSSSSSTLEAAVNYAWNNGVVVVAAAGNSDTSAVFYPAGYTNCIAVAATDQNDAKASFSNYGSWVDVAAPGVSIYSTLPNHRNKIGGTNYGSLSGTSMASPFVAGLAGLIWSTSYGTTNGDVRDRIQTTADQTGSIWSSYGIKRINAYNAVASAEPLPDTTPPETTILAKPANPTSSTSASFSWTGSDDKTQTASLVYSYRLVGDKEWSEFSGNTAADYSGLAEGQHTFEVKAKDESENVDPTPASWSWVIDLTSPVISDVATVPAATTATITWTTNEPADSRIDYGSTDIYGSFVSDPALVAAHTLTLTGLLPDTTYHYQVSSRDAAGNPSASGGYTFTTTSALTMSIENVSVVLVKAGVNYTGQATITIVANGSAVQGATVSGQWSGATGDSDTGVTDASGTVVVSSNKVLKPASGTVFTFTVTSVTHPDFDWDDVSASGSATLP